MKRTLAWPPRFEGGGLAMTADPDDALADDPGEALRQIVRLRMLPGENGNPFNSELGLDGPTWQPLNQRTATQARAQVITQFEALEQGVRARLIAVDVIADADDGILRINVDYEDLETGRRESLEVPLNA